MIFISLSFFIFVNSILVSYANLNQNWVSFKTANKKKYATAEEENLKFSIWEANKKYIDDHNARYKQGLETYTLKMNQYGDMTAKQFSSYLDGFDLGLLKGSLGELNEFSFNESLGIPTSVDWRLTGCVTGIKNQGACGSCYSFSAIGALETLNCLRNKKLVEFSEQMLLDCTYGGQYGNMGCQGGLMDNCFSFVMKNGIKLSTSYPYTGKKEICRIRQTPGASFKIRGFSRIAAGDEDALAQAIFLQGCVSVGIDASQTSFQFYESGVYNEPNCSSFRLNHGVLACGFDTDPETELDYYIIKNSWGASWGELGYIKMSRNNNNNCGIATIASFPTL